MTSQELKELKESVARNRKQKDLEKSRQIKSLLGQDLIKAKRGTPKKIKESYALHVENIEWLKENINIC